MGFKTSIVVESLISTIIQFGVFFLILYFEGMDMYSDIIAVVVMFAYMGVVMLFCHGSKGATDVWSILEGANKRRLGFDILFLIAFTLIPIRAINIIALTIAVDAIITLLPGKAICYGKKLWEFSKVAYNYCKFPFGKFTKNTFLGNL